jgi:hypothetical protein
MKFRKYDLVLDIIVKVIEVIRFFIDVWNMTSNYYFFGLKSWKVSGLANLS